MKPNQTASALILAAICLAASPAQAPACSWDSDTLLWETRKFPGIAEVLTGRFERQPPRYYAMRLERITRKLESQAATLEDFDDAGVACDRLRRSSDAIDWMARKAAMLATLDPADPHVKEHQYRYHANLGTFQAHRWLRAGAHRDDLSDLLDAEGNIAAGLRINPDAHFGREKYQLAAIQWLIQLPPLEPPYSQPTLLQILMDTPRFKGGLGVPDDAVKGLTGLIVLGEARESVDIHWALAAAVRYHGEPAIAFLGELRLKELLNSGARSLHPQFDPKVEPFLKGGNGPGGSISEVRDEISEWFPRARAAAEEWNRSRWEYMEARFNEGRHPDTDPSFWSGWSDTPPPIVPWGKYTWPVKATALVLGFLVIRYVVRSLNTPAPRVELFPTQKREADLATQPHI